MHQEFGVPEILRDSIQCFWYDRRDVGEHPSRFDVMPDGYAEIIFYFGSLHSPSYFDGRMPLPSPFMMGLLNQPALFDTEGVLEIIGVRCFPWTVFDMLGLPSGKDRLQVFEHPIARLQPVLSRHLEAGELADAIGELNQYFVNVQSQIAAESMLFKAGAAMRRANGTLPVSQVAAAAHATVRTLERNFKQRSGHTVKDVSSLMRFEQARNRLWHFPDTSLAGLAHELGYADQAHLGREFKRYSGSTPAAFARKAKKGKQFVSADFVAFVQA